MWQVIGQSRLLPLLQRSLEKGTLAHAYLFGGPASVGKMTLALNLAQVLNCEANEPPCGDCGPCQKIAQGKHADVQIIGLANASENDEAKTRTEISIEQIRQLQHSASLPPFEGRYKVFIIDGAELLSIEAANSLLKTLEEPVAGVVFVLLTTNIGLLPDTVISRCQKLELHPMLAGEVEKALTDNWSIEPQKAKLLSRLCRGCIGWAISAARNDELLKKYYEDRDSILDIISTSGDERFTYAAQLASQFSQRRESTKQILNLWLDLWRDLLLLKTGFIEAITNIDFKETLTELAEGFNISDIREFIGGILAAREQLRQNANPRLVLEVLMLDIPRRRREGVRNK